ncbi:MAG: hypothetical protein QMB42_00695 [SAR324 cluster bacterium]|jgi:hypothetical protein|tara:strand:- start:1014 stop:1634 length:621 start_codon:yes stop_codon:yes gene_type:complete
MTKTLERHGLLICSISILMVTQLRWAESRNYGDIAERLSAAILLGTLLTWGLGKWLTSLEGQTENDKWQRRIKDISFTLSFSFLMVGFHQDGQLGGLIVFLFLIYLIKSKDKARTWLIRLLNSKNFEVELDETKEHLIVLIKGKHDPDNLVAFQYLCVDLSEIFFEMKGSRGREVRLDLQVNNTTNDQILPLIRAIADSHGIKLNT